MFSRCMYQNLKRSNYWKLVFISEWLLITLNKRFSCFQEGARSSNYLPGFRSLRLMKPKPPIETIFDYWYSLSICRTDKLLLTISLQASRMYMGSNGLRSRSVTPDIPDNFSEAGSLASERPSRPSSAKVCNLITPSQCTQSVVSVRK